MITNPDKKFHLETYRIMLESVKEIATFPHSSEAFIKQLAEDAKTFKKNHNL